MQQAHYYFIENASSKRQEFSGLHATVLFLKEHQQGILYVVELPSIKVRYDVETGLVHHSNVAIAGKIKNFFSSDLLKAYLQPIREAIYSLSKLELLLEIAKLEDKELAAFIHSNHFKDQKEFINISLENLNSTLLCIKKKSRQSPLFLTLLKKTQKLSDVHDAVCKVLAEYGVDKIKSKKDVKKIMAQIRDTVEEKKKNTAAMR